MIVQMNGLNEQLPWIRRLLQPKPFRLSKAALETLAIIAYKQPVIRSDVEHVRGVDCGGVLKVLLERGFIRVMGRKEIPGRPLIYGTTRRFLEVFGLETLEDLPTPKEIEELGSAPLETADEIPGENSQPSEAPLSDNAETNENPDNSILTDDEIPEKSVPPEDTPDDDIRSDESEGDSAKNA